MPNYLHALALFLHLSGVVAWVGGMFFAHFALRPAAVEVLPAPLRLALLTATFRRFFRLTAVVVAAVLVSGFAMLLPVGLHNAPLGWHLMLSTGLVMAGIFAFIYGQLFPSMQAQTNAQEWPAAALSLASIRRLVTINLVLGIATIATAVVVRA